MASGIQSSIQAAVSRLLRPLVRLLLRYGVPYGVFADIAKRVYVDLAMDEFAIPGRKPTISRASVITGLTRKEVQRITQLPQLSDEEIQDRYNRAVRVVSGWTRDERYLDAERKPRPLPLENTAGSFGELVRRYSGDAPVRAVLDELVRVGAVEMLASGEVRLLGPVYVPEGQLEDKFGILGSDVADLVSTIDHNLNHGGPDSRFQLKVSYDNLPADALGPFRRDASERSLELLQMLDAELSKLDRDTNPDVGGQGRMRAGLAIYYFEEDLEGTDGDAKN